MLGGTWWWLHTLGRGLVLQAMFISMVLGVGGLALPLMTRGEAPPDGAATPTDRAARLAHVAGAMVLLASFGVEQQSSLALAYALRAAVIALVLLSAAKLWKRPALPGFNRWAIWIAAWMLPLGYAVAAIAPEHPKAGLHVTFIGGLALLTLSVGAQVILAHG